ncbi:hypothetical protein FLL45_13640 [Aliikangiella marina]|uniref:Uncharacterized protein n=1 Tax=Aliikangiella marina TaxID=1712262 RepID=A0A545T9L7_9GAMM|nr:hypothetical protein [Aliikangiella marina]TQV73902.1 hypothetical protein FLL45_13640 [Aliikangiella marina]
MTVSNSLLDMEHWCSCAEKAYEEGRSLIVELLDGSTKEIELSDAEGEFDCLGEMLKEVLFKAKEEGFFWVYL